MTRRFRIAMVSALLCLLAVAMPAQTGGKKSYTFHGKVTAVDAGAKRLTVANEKIEGWMDAMTMGYAVDKDDVFQRVKAGDQITATVYDGDYTLHNVEVAPTKPPAKK